MKRWIWLGLAGSVLMLAACQQEASVHEQERKASAAESTEAASTDFVEGETGKVSDKADDLEKRLDNLEDDLKTLGSSTGNHNGGGNPPSTFTDVPTGSNPYWAYTEIMSLYGKGIIKGYPEEGKFYPERYITRYQAASMIIKALNLPLSSSPSVFKDINSSSGIAKEVMTVYEAGIFNGSDGNFLPNEPMKRRHMAMVLARSFHLIPLNTPFSGYNDVSEKMDGYEEIKSISQYGIAQGSNGSFHPEAPTKRSQFSAFIYRALEKIKP
ncbi:S-layer homology domain-containing protein [Falsibacillus pallidus]|uniref:S-layer homology domain-containing protein n=1 Tax=Falsibacillus pallidus TaxID=493781 RepID=UPI003D95F88C